MSLSGKTAQEISEMLDEFGIKHGPVVDTTRSLYERKIKEAMAKVKRGNSSPDKTFYREEEEVTYEYRTPFRSDSDGPDRTSNLWSRPEWSEREFQPETPYSASFLSSQPRFRPDYRGHDAVDHPYMYDSPASYRSSVLQPSQAVPSSAPSSALGSGPRPAAPAGLVPTWIQILVFLVLAVFLYLVFSNMESNEPLQGIE